MTQYDPPMSRETREQLRRLINEKKREELRKHQARLERNKTSARRRSTWNRYYWNNRDQILAKRAKRKRAA